MYENILHNMFCQGKHKNWCEEEEDDDDDDNNRYVLHLN